MIRVQEGVAVDELVEGRMDEGRALICSRSGEQICSHCIRVPGKQGRCHRRAANDGEVWRQERRGLILHLTTTSLSTTPTIAHATELYVNCHYA